MSDGYTPSAWRALERASRLATREQLPVVGPEHLLRSLLSEEHRASEFLARMQVPLEVVDEAQESALRATHITAVPGDGLRTVIVAAQTIARQTAQGGEVATEHLLWGLMSVPSTAKEWLHASGIREGHLQTLLGQTPKTSPTVAAANELPYVVDLPQAGATVTDHTLIYRILDAASNRAREALRTIEDFTRFVQSDASITRQLKELRHDLTTALRRLPEHRLLAARDTEHDVGTTIATASEGHRVRPMDVVIAGCKRVQETLRTLEEFSKIVKPEAAAEFEQLRYRTYTLEKRLVLATNARQRLAAHPLYLLVTSEQCHHSVERQVEAALAAGVRIVQVREKGWTDRALVEHALMLRALTKRYEALLIINDRPDLAVVVDADGVHVGQDELSVAHARQIVGPDRLVGVSTHSLDQAERAVIDGADYLGVGPTFPSSTKTFDQFAGLDFVRQMAGLYTIPWYAIGGIAPSNIEQVVAAGATRVAVSGCICQAEEPRDVVSQLLSWLHRS